MILVVWLAGVLFSSAQESETCRIEIRLANITCLSANDDPDAHDEGPPRGEYFVRLDSHQEVGPFELKAGENSAFAPGLLLKSIDTGVLKVQGDREIVISVNFVIHVREDDSIPTGEDDVDDQGVPVEVRERVMCPGTTTLRRNITIPPQPNFEDGERPDVVGLSLQIIAR